MDMDENNEVDGEDEDAGDEEEEGGKEEEGKEEEVCWFFCSRSMNSALLSLVQVYSSVLPFLPPVFFGIRLLFSFSTCTFFKDSYSHFPMYLCITSSECRG